MKVGAVIQARMGSTRLPGKVMINICGKSILSHVIERVKLSKKIDDIIVATTNNDSDEVIVDEALKCGVKVFRGSSDDVLSRFYFAAIENKIDIIVRITSDCPLIDYHIVDHLVEFYKGGNNDIVTNAGIDLDKRKFPRGLDASIFSFKVLENAYNKATEKYHREHVTPYIYENSKKIYVLQNSIDYSRHRWTLDTKEDLELITKIYEKFYRGEHNFFMDDILDLIVSEPNLAKININIKQKKMTDV